MNKLVSFFASLFGLLFLNSNLVIAQTHARMTLDIGGSITVWLGEPKQDVLHELSKAQYEILSSPHLPVTMVRYGKAIYSLGFESDRLTFANRNWYTENNDEIESVIGALASLATNADSPSCAVFHELLSEPDITGQKVLVRCGSREILIAKGKAVGGKNFSEVSERIGEYPRSK
jgi:hypothetical protein